MSSPTPSRSWLNSETNEDYDVLPAILFSDVSGSGTPATGRAIASSSSPIGNDTNDIQSSTQIAPSLYHRFVAVSVSYPLLCHVCDDYIITPRCSAYQCAHCKALFHSVCSKVLTDTPRERCCKPDALSDAVCIEDVKHSFIPTSAVSTSQQPLYKWTCAQIAHWLAVIGLGRFVMLFDRRGIDGAFLLQLVPFSPNLDQVVDLFSRQALRRAILALNGAQPTAGDDPVLHEQSLLQERFSANPNSSPNLVGAEYKHHQFELCSFRQEVACHFCQRALLGLAFQGYQCLACGQIFHRVCKALDNLPPCSEELPTVDPTSAQTYVAQKIEYNDLPTALVPYDGDYFGVPLEKQTIDPETNVPVFLLTCINQIEHLAAESLNNFDASSDSGLPIDLLTVYQQSASTSSVSEMWQTFAHLLPVIDSTDTQPLDAITRLAQILKSFLRDLPVSVIPEQHYDSFMALALLETVGERNQAVSNFIDALPPLHQACLTRIMKHMDFVCSHQQNIAQNFLSSDRSRSVEQPNRPSSWLLIFRQILIRPPWCRMTDIATSLEIHLRGLRNIFLALTNPLAESHSIFPLPDSIQRRSRTPNMQGNERAPRTKDLPGGRYRSLSSFTLDHISSSTLSSSISRLDNKHDLSTREWYWSDVTQAEVRELMDGLPDGHFLVRDASERSTGVFTLAVRCHGENKLYRIYHRDGYFGLNDPPSTTFRTVAELIDFYRQPTSMLRLTLPVSRHHDRHAHSGLTETQYFPSQKQLLSDLQRIDEEMNHCDEQLRELNEQSRESNDSKEEATKQIKGNNLLRKWLFIQLNRLANYSTQKERGQLSEQTERLKEMLREAQRRIEANKSTYNIQHAQATHIIEKQYGLMNHKKILNRDAQKIRRALKDQGVHEDVIYGSCDTLVSASDTLSSKLKDTIRITATPVSAPATGTSSDTVHFRSRTASHRSEAGSSISSQSMLDMSNRSAWFVRNISREQVEELLLKKVAGSFLIRPSTDGKKLALGVRLPSSVQHCLIHQKNGKYGFVEKACSFDSLESLIMYYHTNSLKHHNAVLDITLKYPAFARSQ